MADRKRTLLRLPEKLHTAIEDRAKQRMRSVNSEMIVLLKLGFVNADNEAQGLRAADALLTKEETSQESKS